MKKSITTIKEWATYLRGWWMLTFRNTLVREVEFDAYKVTFRRFTMDITTKSGNMKLRMDWRMEYPTGFMLSALQSEDYNAMRKFCSNVYSFIALHTCDETLRNDIQNSFNAFFERKNEEAKLKANEITPDDDKLNEEVVKANIEVAKMTKAERKAHKEAIREVLTNEEE